MLLLLILALFGAPADIPNPPERSHYHARYHSRAWYMRRYQRAIKRRTIQRHGQAQHLGPGVAAPGK